MARNFNNWLASFRDSIADYGYYIDFEKVHRNVGQYHRLKIYKTGGDFILLQPNHFKLEETSIWSFPERGKWATHSGKYRGNWSPYVPRNLILRYSKPGDWVLDQFLGSGTTLVEAKLLNRNGIGIDINPKALSLSKTNLSFQSNSKSQIFLKKGNAANLSFIKDNRIDFICTHPPYSNIIPYSSDLVEDISLCNEKEFIIAMKKVAEESFRVLKKGKYCAVMIGDKRIHGYVIPLGFQLLTCFLETGFVLKEIIIKVQHNCRATPKWQDKNKNFLMLAHEYIFVFYKPNF